MILIKNLQKITQDEWQIANHVIELFISSNKITTDLWNVNVIQYCAVLTVFEKNDGLKAKNTKAGKKQFFFFQTNISYISVMLQCQNSNTPLTKH